MDKKISDNQSPSSEHLSEDQTDNQSADSRLGESHVERLIHPLNDAEPEITKDLYRAMAYDHRVDEAGSASDGGGVPYNFVDDTSLWPVHAFVMQVLRSDAQGFRISERTAVGAQVVTLPLGRMFPLVKGFLLLSMEGVALYGLVGLFFDSCAELQINPCLLAKPGMPYLDGKLCADVFNDLLACIRRRSKSPKFQSLMSNLEYRVNRSFKSMKNYVDALFDKHAKLLVLRLDFGYHRRQGTPIRLERLLRDFNRFLANRRGNSLFDHMVGYIRRIEYGHDKSWHLHVMLFFNGQELQSHSQLAHLIGQYWKTVITDNDGVFFNCNHSRNRYKYNGIGTVYYDDKVARTHLLYALSYLTKKDYVFGFEVPEDCKMITRGEMPKLDGVKLGRPRKAT